MTTSDSPVDETTRGRRTARWRGSLMRRAWGGRAVALLVIAAIGCAGGEGLTGPQRDAFTPGSAPRASIFGATTVTTPYVGDSFNPCPPGELVPVRGKVSYSGFVSSLDVYHERVKFSWVMDGEGSLGNVYHGSEEFVEELNVSTFPMETTIVHLVHMVSPSAPDYYEKMLFHLTINATGQPTATVEKDPTPECRQ